MRVTKTMLTRLRDNKCLKGWLKELHACVSKLNQGGSKALASLRKQRREGRGYGRTSF